MPEANLSWLEGIDVRSACASPPSDGSEGSGEREKRGQPLAVA